MPNTVKEIKLQATVKSLEEERRVLMEYVGQLASDIGDLQERVEELEALYQPIT
jgi:hypothetical protein